MIFMTELEIMLPHHAEFTVGDTGDYVCVAFGGYRFRTRSDTRWALEGRFGQLELANVDISARVERDSGNWDTVVTGTSLPAALDEVCSRVAEHLSLDVSEMHRFVYENVE